GHARPHGRRGRDLHPAAGLRRAARGHHRLLREAGAALSMSRAERVLQRKEAVLEAALACFEELGYDNTSIEDIRARSGASIGSIYHHFGRKEVIAAALYVDTLVKYRAGLRRRAAEA